VPGPRAQDESRIAPGGDDLLALLAEGPNLILLDETLQYLISAGGIKIEQTTLRDETLTFLQRLTVAVGNTTNTALVFSLQSSKRESLEYVNLLQTVDHLAARKDQRREPVEGSEILSVIQRRLLAKLPKDADSLPAATAYVDRGLKEGHARAENRATSVHRPNREEAISARSEPAPLSRLLVTVSVLGTQRSSSPSSMGRAVRRAAGVFLLDAVREVRPRRFDSQRVNDIVRVSISRLVCDTMKKPTIPARRPSAGARPGR
jgi:hypothetical protein